MQKMRWMLLGTAVLALATLSSSAVAQENYPSNSIKLEVGFAAGGSADQTARLIAQKLSSQMNGVVVVENKPGANSNIAAEFVAKSKADGYTLLFASTSQVLSVAFGEKLGYDLFKDLTPIATLSFLPMVLFLHPSVPANTPAEFIAHLKANPDKLAYGSAGVGSINHLSDLLFLQLNGLSALHVPYKGGVPVLADLVGGRLQFSMASATSMLPMAKQKRIKALAIAGLKRSPLMPDVPTLAETVMPGFEIGIWYAVMAPAKMPSAIVARLSAEIGKALQDPEMKAKLEQDGAQIFATATAEEFGTYLKSELERWTKVIKSAGVTLE